MMEVDFLIKKVMRAEWLLLGVLLVTNWEVGTPPHPKALYSDYNNIIVELNRMRGPLLVNPVIPTFMLDVDVEAGTSSSWNTPPSCSRLTNHNDAPPHTLSSFEEACWGHISDEDASVIEAMWLQDEDLGVTKEAMQSFFELDETEVLKKQQSLDLQEKEKEEEEKKKNAEKEEDPWFGLDFTVDNETGESTLLPSKGAAKEVDDVSFPLPLGIDVPEFSLNDALDLVEGFKDPGEEEDIPETVVELSSSVGSSTLGTSLSSNFEDQVLVEANTNPDNPGRKPPDSSTVLQEQSQSSFLSNQSASSVDRSSLTSEWPSPVRPRTVSVNSQAPSGSQTSPSPHNSPLASQIVPSGHSSPTQSSYSSSEEHHSSRLNSESSSDEVVLNTEEEAADWVTEQLHALTEASSNSVEDPGPSNETQKQLEEELDNMIQAAQLHPHHPRAFQGRMPLMPSMGPVMEQRWGELSGLLGTPGASPDTMAYTNPHQVTSPYSPYPTYPHPMSELNVHYPAAPAHPMVGGIGSAVATSMSLNNPSDPNVEAMTQHHDSSMYYQGGAAAAAAATSGPSEVNQGGDHIMNTIINDDDLHFVDMAVNEGMYNMRMLEGEDARATGGRADWGTHGPSEAGATPYTAIDYTNSAAKYRGFNGYSSPAGDSERRCMPPQKKHQLFGRHRGYPDPTTMHSANYTAAGAVAAPPMIKLEYHSPQLGSYSHLDGAAQMESCGFEYGRHPADLSHLDHLRNNHTYALAPESAMQPSRPHARDKHKGRREEQQTCRDEKRARAMGIPLSADEIVHLPMDEFNEKLSRYDLTEPQLSLIRDIRRRGKNKVAAQNCRKRKMDQIMCLADEVKDIRTKRERMEHQLHLCTQAYAMINDKFSRLYRHVFSALRDADGNPYSSYDWSLQQSADGSIVLVPRNATNTTEAQPEARPKYRDPQD